MDQKRNPSLAQNTLLSTSTVISVIRDHQSPDLKYWTFKKGSQEMFQYEGHISKEERNTRNVSKWINMNIYE